MDSYVFYPFKNLTLRTKIYRLHQRGTKKGLSKTFRTRHNPFRNKPRRKQSTGWQVVLIEHFLKRLQRCPLGPHIHYTKPQALAAGTELCTPSLPSPSHCREKAPFPFTTTTSRSFRPSPTSVRERNGNLAGWPPGEKYPSEGLKETSNRQSTNTRQRAANTHLNPAAIFPPARVRLRRATLGLGAAGLHRPQTFGRDACALRGLAADAGGWAWGRWFLAHLCSGGF